MPLFRCWLVGCWLVVVVCVSFWTASRLGFRRRQAFVDGRAGGIFFVLSFNRPNTTTQPQLTRVGGHQHADKQDGRRRRPRDRLGSPLSAEHGGVRNAENGRPRHPCERQLRDKVVRDKLRQIDGDRRHGHADGLQFARRRLLQRLLGLCRGLLSGVYAGGDAAVERLAAAVEGLGHVEAAGAAAGDHGADAEDGRLLLFW